MCNDTTNEFVEIADKSIRETIETFFDRPSGFHGDTGLQHFLYHRILSNAGAKIFWQSSTDSNMRTLLFQSEVYTHKTYRYKGRKPSSGRFDMAFVEPPKIAYSQSQILHERLKAIIAFEVGRNKGIGDVGNFQAPVEEDGPMPGDAAKILRDLRFGGLKTGYILEFFDQANQASIRKGQQLAKELFSFLESIERIDCRVAVCLLAPKGNSLAWFYPNSWPGHLKRAYKLLNIKEDIVASDSKRINRVTFEKFLEVCGECNRHLQKAIHKKYSKTLKLLYGKKTMTVNLRPKGRLFRIGNLSDSSGECIYEIVNLIAEVDARSDRKLIKTGRIYIPERTDEDIISSILRLLSQALDK